VDWAPVAGQKGPGPEQLEEVVTFLMSLYITLYTNANSATVLKELEDLTENLRHQIFFEQYR